MICSAKNAARSAGSTPGPEGDCPRLRASLSENRQEIPFCGSAAAAAILYKASRGVPPAAFSYGPTHALWRGRCLRWAHA